MSAESRLQQALLALFLSLLWWIVGVLSGSVAAFAVYSRAFGGFGSDSTAIVVFAAVALGLGVFGTRRAWQLYRKGSSGPVA